MSDEEKKFDGLLMTILQQEKQINGFFDRVFGFLRRSTDFFANEKLAEQSLTSTCKKNFEIFQKQKAEKAQEEARKKKKEEERKLKQKQAAAKTTSNVQQPQPAKIEPKIQPASTNEAQPAATQGEAKDNQPAPKGNGGKNDRYIWTQTLQELHIYIPVRSDINKKQLVVKISTQTLFVQDTTKPAIIDGKFFQKINAEDSLWTIEDGQVDDYKGKYVHISIQKWKNQNSWWSTPIKGDVEINTQKINPEPSQLSDLEGQTKSTVEKMMFDMRQKQMGKPTSDQLQKQEKLQEFMKAHPEMDFSKCKFN